MTSADVILIAELLNVHPRQPQWSKLIYIFNIHGQGKTSSCISSSTAKKMSL